MGSAAAPAAASPANDTPSPLEPTARSLGRDEENTGAARAAKRSWPVQPAELAVLVKGRPELLGNLWSEARENTPPQPTQGKRTKRVATTGVEDGASSGRASSSRSSGPTGSWPTLGLAGGAPRGPPADGGSRAEPTFTTRDGAPRGAPALRVERVYLRQLVARPEDRPLTRVAQLNGNLLHCNHRLEKGPEALQRSGIRAARPVDAPALQVKKVRGIR